MPTLTEAEKHVHQLRLDIAVRHHPTCPGCGKQKDPGCIVCWECFKYRDNCYKYFANDTPLAGDLDAWLESIGRPSLAEQGIHPCRVSKLEEALYTPGGTRSCPI